MEKYLNGITCGDCLQLIKEIPEKNIHLVFTSPPYYNAREYSEFDDYQDYLKLIESFVKESHRVLNEGRFLIINASPVIEKRKKRHDQSKRYPIPFDIHSIVMKNDFLFIDDIIWVKPEPSTKNRNAGFNRHRKPIAYKPNSVTEYLMVYRKKTDRLIDWNLRQYDDEIIEDSLIRGEYERSNVWHINPDTSEDHPATFPEELSDKVIGYYTMKEDVVLDPFIGSGTTAVSCKKLSRNYIGFEKKKEYCQMAIERVNNFKPSKDITQYFSRRKKNIGDYFG